MQMHAQIALMIGALSKMPGLFGTDDSQSRAIPPRNSLKISLAHFEISQRAKSSRRTQRRRLQFPQIPYRHKPVLTPFRHQCN
jgi:hypothetical protein